jgi:hypothetical protein
LVLTLRNRYVVDQWNRIEDPEMNSYNNNHLIFDKGAKNIHCRKDSLGKAGCPHAEDSPKQKSIPNGS